MHPNELSCFHCGGNHQSNECQDQPDKEGDMNAVEAGTKCDVKGFIARKSAPGIKLWKCSAGFYYRLSELQGNDWECHDMDPELH